MLFNTVVPVLSLSIVALAQGPPAQNNDQAANMMQGLDPALMQQFMPQYNEAMQKFYKYATVSGFDEFHSALVASAMQYAATQTYLSAEPTGNPLANPNIIKLIDEVTKSLESYVATETFLPKSVKSSLNSDFKSLVAGVSSVTAEMSAKTSGSYASQSTGARSSKTSSDASASETASSTSSSAPSQPTSSQADSRAAGLSTVIVFSAALVAGISALAVLL